MILENISNPEELLTKPKYAAKRLIVAFSSQRQLIDTFLMHAQTADTQKLTEIVSDISERMLKK